MPKRKAAKGEVDARAWALPQNFVLHRNPRKTLRVRIIGKGPLLEQNPARMRDAHIKTKEQTGQTKKRQAWDAEAECKAHVHRLMDGRPGVPCIALKKAMAATVSGKGQEWYGRRKELYSAFWIRGEANQEQGGMELLPIISPNGDYVVDRSWVRNSGIGRPIDVRARPRWDKWALDVEIEFKTSAGLTEQTLLDMLDEAGDRGIVSRRQENSGENYGTFEVAVEA